MPFADFAVESAPSPRNLVFMFRGDAWLTHPNPDRRETWNGHFAVMRKCGVIRSF